MGFCRPFHRNRALETEKIPVLADYPNFAPWSNFWRFFRPAPRRRFPALTSGPNCTKLGFLCSCRPFHLNRALKREDTIISRLARFWSFFGAFSAGSKTTLPFAYPLTELHQTRFLGLLEQLLAFFRPAPRRRFPALTSGRNCTKLGFLCSYRPFHLNRALETGRTPLLADCTVLVVFWRFSAGSKTTLPFALPLDRIAPNSVSWAFAGHSTGSSVRNGKIPVLAGSKTTLSCAYPLTELHQTRFLGLLQAIPPESSVRNGKIPVLAGSKTTLSCAYLWAELHQTRFPVLLQAIHLNRALETGRHHY